jgi:hypothetical protein
MVAYRKISPRRAANLPGPRRKKPPIRQQNRALKALVEGEHELLQSLLRDAEVRRAFWIGAGRTLEPLAVWTDFDHTYLHTETDPRHLSGWSDLTEYMKLQLAFLMGLEFGGYSFTVNVHRDLEAKWKSTGSPIEKMVQKRCRAALEAADLSDLGYGYVIEGRSRSGKSRTHLHVHGFLLGPDPMVATRFKVAMERALLRDRTRHVRAAKGIDIQPSFDRDTGDGRGRGRWVSYFTKNAGRWDARIRGRRVFMSRPLTQVAREFWELLRTDPFTTSGSP